MTDLSAESKPERHGDNSISSLQASLSPAGKVKVTVALHEGNDRPNLSFSLFDAQETLLARSFIIQCIDLQVDFTLHIRQPDPAFPLTLRCESFFEDDSPLDSKMIYIPQPEP